MRKKYHNADFRLYHCFIQYCHFIKNTLINYFFPPGLRDLILFSIYFLIPSSTETIQKLQFFAILISGKRKNFSTLFQLESATLLYPKGAPGWKKKRERKERNIKQALWDILKLSWYMPCLWVKTAIILLERGYSAIKGNFRVVLELGVYLHLDIIVSWALFAVNSPKHL